MIISKKKRMVIEDLRLIEAEIKILRRMDHTNVIRLMDWVNSRKRVYRVYEYHSGDTVEDRLRCKKRMSEEDTQRVMQQVMAGVDYIHGCQIIHRDLTPDHLIVEDGHVKLTHFRLAMDWRREANRVPKYGDDHYAAPEMLIGHTQGPSCDAWSVGVIAYRCLSGELPFSVAEPGDHSALHKLILTEVCSFHSPVWDVLSDQAQEFTAGLLTKDPQSRMSAAQSLKHPWLCQSLISD